MLINSHSISALVYVTHNQFGILLAVAFACISLNLQISSRSILELLSSFLTSIECDKYACMVYAKRDA